MDRRGAEVGEGVERAVLEVMTRAPFYDRHPDEVPAHAYVQGNYSRLRALRDLEAVS
jgi:hypothetical protein